LSLRLSDRHTGIGGDGVVLILRSAIADAKMRMFNIDGSEGNMCGNAIRCVAKYLYDNKIVIKKQIRIETLSGIKTLEVFTKNANVSSVKVDMGKPELKPELIPVMLKGANVISQPVIISGEKYQMTCVSMGNPHTVVFVDNIDALDLVKLGPLFENSELFPERVNTEFVVIEDRNHLKMRVWERGSGETLACGTGACAAAVAAVLNGHCDKDSDIEVQALGGR
ncbi:MAG TPA: diaminopimelate epimerase, partial [Treponema sp.]|nr:diaminopimelate epimerase [Treponema sp.]